MIFRFFPLAVVFCCMAGSASALIQCQLTQGNNNGNMPPVIVISHDAQTNEATVGHSWIDGPMQHTTTANPTANGFELTVRAPLRAAGRTIRVSLRMDYNRGTRRLNGRMMAPAGFAGSIRGDYACAES